MAEHNKTFMYFNFKIYAMLWKALKGKQQNLRPEGGGYNIARPEGKKTWPPL